MVERETGREEEFRKPAVEVTQRPTNESARDSERQEGFRAQAAALTHQYLEEPKRPDPDLTNTRSEGDRANPTREQDRTEHFNLADAVNAKMDAYKEKLQVDHDKGQISREEMVRREKLYDQDLARAIQQTPLGQQVKLPDPTPAHTSEEARRANRPGSPSQESQVIDWGRSAVDPQYRKQVEQELRAARAAGMQIEKGAGRDGQQQTGRSRGREL